MASITLGVGTSHTPMVSMPPEVWAEYAEGDRSISELVFPPDGLVRSYDEVETDRDWLATVPFEGADAFPALAERCAKALEELRLTISAEQPDAVVIISNDQDEWFFDDNMPAFSVYWGKTVAMRPYSMPRGRAGAVADGFRIGYGDQYLELPVASELGLHLIEHLIEAEFDVSHTTRTPESRGGLAVRRYFDKDGPVDISREVDPRPVGLPHGFSFVVRKLFGDSPPPIVPVFQNTCYPPNRPTPGRCFSFGAALADAIESWESSARVCVIASGGLSHFVVDEELDLTVLGALEVKDEDALRQLDGRRLYSAASEVLNWVSLGGAVQQRELKMQLVDYVPVYRTPVGTGGGWAFATWQATPTSALSEA